MFSSFVRGAAPLLLLLSVPALAQNERPITPDDLMAHIEVLASDDFRGRYPGTEGETKTTNYIVEQFRARGLEPAGPNGGWLQPLALVERTARGHQVRWTAAGSAVQFTDSEIVLMGRDASERLADAPVVFAGHGARMPDRGIDQLAGANLQGAVALILLQGPDVEGFPSLAERVAAVTEAGAAAVVTIVGPEVPWDAVRSMLARPTTRPQSDPVPRIIGTMPISSAQRLVAAAGGDLQRLLNDQPGSSFRAVTLPLRGSLDVETGIERFTTNNVIGRVRGSGSTGESLLYLGHWDHLGICRPAGEADRICNGAVDNASGIAMMIEVAGRLAAGPRPERDILFLATTAEEMGLLGAEHFAANPVVPAASIVAAINMDTVAVHPRGEPVAVIGRGVAPLDALIEATATSLGRTMERTNWADSEMARRQDGWALVQAGIPAVMVGGSFASRDRLFGFLQGPYHAPNDQLGGTILLEGAAEDADLLVALGRRLADPSVYRRPRG